MERETLRRLSGEVDFGCHWVLKNEALWSAAPRWRLSWIVETGELYAAAQGPGVQWDSAIPGQLRTMMVAGPPLPAPNRVGIFFVEYWRTRAAIEAFLAGWATDSMAVGPLLNMEAQLEIKFPQNTAYTKRLLR